MEKVSFSELSRKVHQDYSWRYLLIRQMSPVFIPNWKRLFIHILNVRLHGMLRRKNLRYYPFKVFLHVLAMHGILFANNTVVTEIPTRSYVSMLIIYSSLSYWTRYTVSRIWIHYCFPSVRIRANCDNRWKTNRHICFCTVIKFLLTDSTLCMHDYINKIDYIYKKNKQINIVLFISSATVYYTVF